MFIPKLGKYHIFYNYFSLYKHRLIIKQKTCHDISKEMRESIYLIRIDISQFIMKHCLWKG